MDAEVWSHADIRNGHWLFAVLSGVILSQQAVLVVLTGMGFPLVMVVATGGPFADVPDVVRAGFGFVLSLLLFFLALAGRGWARWSLAFVIFLPSLATVLKAGPSLCQTLIFGQPPSRALGVSVGLAALGLVAGVLFMVMPSLRAFAWSRSAARDAIPVPVDDGSAPRRALRRHPTLGERAVAFMSALRDGVIILFIVALWILVFGGDGWLRGLVVH